MSTQTPNIGLTKPAGNEKPQVSVINGNSDILDAAIGEVDVSTDGSLQSQVDALRDSVSEKNTMDIILTSTSKNTFSSAEADLSAYKLIALCVRYLGRNLSTTLVSRDMFMTSNNAQNKSICTSYTDSVSNFRAEAYYSDGKVYVMCVADANQATLFGIV